jgi:hypothetical protein
MSTRQINASGVTRGGGFFQNFTENGVNRTEYTTLGGQTFGDYGAYTRGVLAERQSNPDLYSQAESAGFSGPSSSSLGNQFSDILEQNFQNTSRLMDLTNQYRTREGATQGQMDEQAFRRLRTQLDTQERMQVRGAELEEGQRRNDYNRATSTFRGRF